MLEGLSLVEQYAYEGDFCVSDGGFTAGRVADTTSTRLRFWSRWVRYARGLGIDPYLEKNSTEKNSGKPRALLDES